MKKLLLGLMLAGTMVFGAKAAENIRWPIWFGFNDVEDVDVVGWRINWFSGQCDQVTGIDFLGFIGHSTSFNGIQFNLLRNDVVDVLAGWQIGLYNTAGRCDAAGLQLGLWNEVGEMHGVQAGLVNNCDELHGGQLGLINISDSAQGFQIGLINIIKGGTDIPFCPILNVGF